MRTGRPLLHLPLTGPAWVELPYSKDNGDYLARRLGGKKERRWSSGKGWEIKRSKHRQLLDDLVHDYGSTRFLWQVRGGQSQCDTRCQAAVGMECRCVCGGLNHGAAAWGGEWELVGGTTLIATDEPHWLSRVIERGQAAA